MNYGYIRLGRAWYAESALRGRDFEDEIMILVEVDEGTNYEMAIRFYDLVDHGLAARLEIFDDAFAALCLAPIKKLIGALCKLRGKAVSMDGYESLLDRLGFDDLTPEEQ